MITHLYTSLWVINGQTKLFLLALISAVAFTNQGTFSIVRAIWHARIARVPDEILVMFCHVSGILAFRSCLELQAFIYMR